MPFSDSNPHSTRFPDTSGFSGHPEEIRRHMAEYEVWMAGLPEDRLDRAYAPGKWTPRILLGHVVDSHIRIAFRILSLGRGEFGELLGPDGNLWATLAAHEKMPLAGLVRGYRAAAVGTDWIAGTMLPESMNRNGVTNDILPTVRELQAYIIAHERHHRRILAERYGLGCHGP